MAQHTEYLHLLRMGNSGTFQHISESHVVRVQKTRQTLGIFLLYRSVLFCLFFHTWEMFEKTLVQSQHTQSRPSLPTPNVESRSLCRWTQESTQLAAIAHGTSLLGDIYIYPSDAALSSLSPKLDHSLFAFFFKAKLERERERERTLPTFERTSSQRQTDITPSICKCTLSLSLSPR